MQDDAAPLLDTTAIARSKAPLAQAWTLPPTAYTNPHVFAAERETLFRQSWLCVARQEQLPKTGDYRCVDLPDQPIVIARGRDGKLRAFSRICLHRAMPIAEGQGNTTRFVCPYHHWTYELDGALRSAPMMDGVTGFDAKACRLPELALEIWQGFVFVSLEADPAPLAPQLSGLSELVQNYELSDMVVVDTITFDSPWNWKILVENFMEAYHHIGTHKTSFEPAYPARASTVADNDGAPWTFLWMPGRADAPPEPSLLPKLSGAQQNGLFAACVYPTMLFGASARGGAWYELSPSAHDHMQLKIHALMPRAIAQALRNDDLEALAATLRAVHEEDITANEGPWAGLQASMTGQGRLSLYEKAIWQLNQLWLDRVGLG